MDRRNFLSASVLGLGGLALGKLLAPPPVNSSAATAQKPLVYDKFVRQLREAGINVPGPGEPLPPMDIRGEIEELGLAFCRSLPFGSDWYYARSDGKLAFWSCITTPRFMVRFDDEEVEKRVYLETYRSVQDLWLAAKPSILKAREEGRPFVAITEPTVQVENITDSKTGETIGQEWWSFIHLTKDVPWPHPLDDPNPAVELVEGARWAAKKITALSQSDRLEAMAALKRQNPTFHSLVKHALSMKRIEVKGDWVVIMPAEGLKAERIDLVRA